MSDIEGQRIAVTCPRCNSRLKVEARFAGTRQNCPECDKPFKIPGVRITSQPSAATDLDDELDDFASPSSAKPSSRTKPAPRPEPAQQELRPPASKPAQQELRPPASKPDQQELPPPAPVPKKKPAPQAPPVIAEPIELGDKSDEEGWSPDLPKNHLGSPKPDPIEADENDADEELGLPDLVESEKPAEVYRPRTHDHARMEVTVDDGEALKIDDGEGGPVSDIAITCEVCGTRVSLREEDLNKSEVDCPDCDSLVPVVIPVAKPKKQRFDTAQGGDLSLEPVSETAHLNIANDGVQLVDAAQEEPWKPKLESREKVPVQCHVCDSRLFANADQVGQNVECNVCGSQVKVLPPPKKKPKNNQPEAPPPVVEFKLSETFERPKFTPLVKGEIPSLDYDIAREAAPNSSGVEPPPVVSAVPVVEQTPRPEAAARAEAKTVEKPAQQRPSAMTAAVRTVLDKAKALDKKEVAERPTLPPSPMWTGVFKVIKDGEFVLRTMISCGMMALVYVGYCWAADLMATGQTFPLILAIMISTLTTVVGAPGMSWAVCCFLTVTNDSSQGCDEIHSWPESWQLIDQIAQSFYMIAALIAAAVPTFVVILMTGGFPPLLRTIAIVGTFLFVYPIVQLSVLEKASILSLLSAPVMRSLGTIPGSWCIFLGQSAVLGFVGVLFWNLMAYNAMWGLVVGPVHGILIMAYCRLLGRLLWVYQEKE